MRHNLAFIILFWIAKRHKVQNSIVFIFHNKAPLTHPKNTHYWVFTRVVIRVLERMPIQQSPVLYRL